MGTKLMATNSLLITLICNLMDVDPSGEEEEDAFGEALLFVESMSFKKK